MRTTTHKLPIRSLPGKDRFMVLEVIAGQHSISIEGLLHAFPWVRWGELFSILSSLKEEGVIVVDQKGFDFIVQINESRLRNGACPKESSYCSKLEHLSSPSNRHLTHS